MPRLILNLVAFGTGLNGLEAQASSPLKKGMPLYATPPPPSPNL
jgi:hypothetical protein